jgi:hypothetical protein
VTPRRIDWPRVTLNLLIEPGDPGTVEFADPVGELGAET